MAKTIKETKFIESADDTVEQRNTRGEPASWTAARVVQLVVGVLLTLLLIRFILSLLGANRANAFADFIYSITGPFVAPFSGLFNYRTDVGVARFELETIIALVVYILFGWLIARALTVKDPPGPA